MGLINIMDKFDFTKAMGDESILKDAIKSQMDQRVFGHLQQIKQDLASKFIEDGENESTESEE